jgi:cell division septation protein DedD
MFQNREGETEILLGNKQIVGIFFILAVLFGAFFTAGYMVGRNSGEKNTEDNAVQASSAPNSATAAPIGETHAVPGDAGAAAGAAPIQGGSNDDNKGRVAASTAAEAAPAARTETVSPKNTNRQRVEEADSDSLMVTPRRGQTYLQVTAVSRSEAEAVAGVLSKRGFHAHFAAGPDTKLFRVLVGPVRDAGELSSTRDALRRKGFRQVFVQRY